MVSGKIDGGAGRCVVFSIDSASGGHKVGDTSCNRWMKVQNRFVLRELIQSAEEKAVRYG